MTQKNRQTLFLVLWLVLVLYCGLFFLQKINLQTADLGRHIKNGQLLLTEGLHSHLLHTNYYSYAAATFTFPNHHWLYGLLVYGLNQLGGFALLTLFNAVVAVLAIGCISISSRKQTGMTATLVSLLLCLPLLTYRTEVRPETVSLLLLSVSLSLLLLFRQKRISFLPLLLLQAVISLLWVNVHLFFVLQLAVLGAFWLGSLAELLKLLFQQSRSSHQPHKSAAVQQAVQYTVLLLTATTITLCNPSGLAGSLAPLHIFGNYHYPVAENQSIFFFIKYGGPLASPNNMLFMGIVLLFFLLVLASFMSNWRHRSLFEWVSYGSLVLTFGLTSLRIVRFIPFFGLLALPILALHLKPVLPKIKTKVQHLTSLQVLLLSPILFGYCLLLLASSAYLPRLASAGLGLYTGVNDVAVFYQNLGLSGPIFNNYDIGSYLIYHLASAANPHPVIVDNRPEMYPEEMLEDQVVAAQKDEAVWQKLLDQYHFESIIFYRHDATDWGQPFLIRRLHDPDWVAVYVDEFAILLLKRSPATEASIQTYALPADTFVIAQ